MGIPGPRHHWHLYVTPPHHPTSSNSNISAPGRDGKSTVGNGTEIIDQFRGQWPVSDTVFLSMNISLGPPRVSCYKIVLFFCIQSCTLLLRYNSSSFKWSSNHRVFKKRNKTHMTITETDGKIPVNLIIKHETSKDTWAGVGSTVKATWEPPIPKQESSISALRGNEEKHEKRWSGQNAGSHKCMGGGHLAHRGSVPLLQGQRKNRALDCQEQSPEI